MPKKDYSKIEDILEKTASEYQKRKLLDESEKILKDKERNVSRPQKPRVPGLAAQEAVLRSILKHLKFIRATSPDHFAKILDLRKRAKLLSDKLGELSLEEWEEFVGYNQRLNKIRTSLQGGEEGNFEDELIQREQKRLKKKGTYHFNINESWDTI